MWTVPNFDLNASSLLSQEARNHRCNNFHQAINFVQQLPYQRNSDKKNLALVFTEQRGTCSTKHAALAQLATDNHVDKIKLLLGIYKMQEKNTPGVGSVLDKYGLDYIPEAHNYLSFQGQRIDITTTTQPTHSPFDVLLKEIEITPDQISDFKVELHQAFLQTWLLEQNVPFSLSDIWKVREECIFALSEIKK